MYWELEKYKLLLEQASAGSKAAETVPAVAAKSDVPTMKEITICRTDTGRCQRKSIRADIDINTDLPDHCKVQEVPLTDEYGQSVTQEVLVCGPEDIPILEKELGLKDLLVPEPVPEFKEVVVCSTLTGTCEMVEVAGDHEVLEGCDVTTVPITTSEGVKMEEAIIVDTPEEAAHYGFSTPDPSKAEEPEMPEPVLPEIPTTPVPVVAEPTAPEVDDLIPAPAETVPQSAPDMSEGK